MYVHIAFPHLYFPAIFALFCLIQNNNNINNNEILTYFKLLINRIFFKIVFDHLKYFIYICNYILQDVRSDVI